jgi:hypothetical protein
MNAPAAFIHPCQPIVAKQAPTGPGWAHELKHDGYSSLRLAISNFLRQNQKLRSALVEHVCIENNFRWTYCK